MDISYVDVFTLLLLAGSDALWFTLLALLVVGPSVITTQHRPSTQQIRNAAVAVLAVGLVSALGMSLFKDDGYAITTGATAIAYAACLWAWTMRGVGPIVSAS